MARIRTIKPSFWTDEKIGSLSYGARLLFIGTWNLADDEGILVWDARYLKGQLFPYDNVQQFIKTWMRQLEENGLITSYQTSKNQRLAYVSRFSSHQVISHPQSSQFELPTNSKDFKAKYTRYSSNSTGTLLDHSNQEEGMEGEGKGREGGTPTTTTTTTTNPPTPLSKNVYDFFEKNFQQLTPFYAETLKDLVKTYTEAWVLDAMRESLNYNKRSLAYVSKILERWNTEGRNNGQDGISGRRYQAGGRRTAAQQEHAGKDYLGPGVTSAAD